MHISKKRLKRRDGTTFTSYTVVIGDEQYDINYFSDSGSWIKKMALSDDKKRLTIWIDKNWFASLGGDSLTHSIISLIMRECRRNVDVFEPVEVLFKLVSVHN